MRSAFLGLVNLKERWRLSARGWLVLLVLLGATLGFVVPRTHAFLAVNKPVDADLLVIEGWIPDDAIRSSVSEFQKGSYRRVYTVGGPVGAWRYAAQFGGTYAGYAAMRLQRGGLNSNVIAAVPAGVANRDRTYLAAVALRDWFRTNAVDSRKINVLTLGPHARRTRLMYQRAFGDGMDVGIISVPDSDYDARHWWRYSEGVKEVLSESVAYLYARFLFRVEN